MQIVAQNIQTGERLPVIEMHFGRVNHKLVTVDVAVGQWHTENYDADKVRLEYSTDGVEWKEF